VWYILLGFLLKELASRFGIAPCFVNEMAVDVGGLVTRTAATVGRPRKVPLLSGAMMECSAAIAAWPRPSIKSVVKIVVRCIAGRSIGLLKELLGNKG